MDSGFVAPNEPYEPLTRLTERNVPADKPAAPVKVTQELRDQLKIGDSYIVTYGEITYNDVFGKHHWIKFCAFGPRTAFTDTKFHKQCVDYNDDDTQIPSN